MVDLQMLKIGIDVALVLALLYLCFRMGKSSSAGAGVARIPGLESSLKLLIKDADEASRELNAKLMKRKSNLENLLFDLETVENRVNRAITSAEEAKGSLELEVSKAGRLRERVEREYTPAVKPEKVRLETEAQEQPRVLEPGSSPAERYGRSEQKAIQPLDTIPEPASFGQDPYAQKSESRREEPERQWGSTNIYGDPIAPASAARGAALTEKAPEPEPQKTYTPLAAAVETERHNPYSVGETANDELQRVYDAAENMLRAGVDLRTVSSRTNLPMDEVKVLSQMLKREALTAGDEVVVDVSDSRLGVLGGIRRRTQTL